MIEPVSVRVISTMADKSKGSITNRAQCTKEHVKNDVSAGLKIGAVSAGLACLAMQPKQKLFNIAAKTGAVIAKGVQSLVNLTKIKSPAVKAVVEKIAHNPKAIGFAALATIALKMIVNTNTKHAYKEGQIDQKYTDSAKIESQSKNIILKDMEQKTIVENA